MVFGTAYAAVGATADDVAATFDIDGAVATFKEVLFFDVDGIVEVLFVVEMHPATRVVTISATAISVLK